MITLSMARCSTTGRIEGWSEKSMNDSSTRNTRCGLLAASSITSSEGMHRSGGVVRVYDDDNLSV